MWPATGVAPCIRTNRLAHPENSEILLSEGISDGLFMNAETMHNNAYSMLALYDDKELIKRYRIECQAILIITLIILPTL